MPSKNKPRQNATKKDLGYQLLPLNVLGGYAMLKKELEIWRYLICLKLNHHNSCVEY